MPAAHFPVALLLVDVINPFDFEGGDALLENALNVAPPIADLATRARVAEVPVIYANDNFAAWKEDFDTLVARCTAPDAIGRSFVEQIAPEAGDYSVLKPKYSAFYQTPLDTLLRQFGTRTVVLAGLATDICVLSSAMDAAMRDLRLIVPQDASAAETEHAHTAALTHFRRVLHAETPPASAVDFATLAEAGDAVSS